MKNLTLVTVASLLALALAGCTPGTDEGFPLVMAPTAAQTETPAVVLDGDQDGNGRLSEWEKSMLVKNSAHDYTLADGTVVSVDPKAPLPSPVAEAIKARAAGYVAAALGTGPDARSANYEALRASLDADAAATGRGIIVVYQAASAGEGLIWVPAISGDKYSPFLGSSDKASVVAEATTWANNKGYDLIVY